MLKQNTINITNNVHFISRLLPLLNSFLTLVTVWVGNTDYKRGPQWPHVVFIGHFLLVTRTIKRKTHSNKNKHYPSLQSETSNLNIKALQNEMRTITLN